MVIVCGGGAEFLSFLGYDALCLGHRCMVWVCSNCNGVCRIPFCFYGCWVIQFFWAGVFFFALDVRLKKKQASLG